MNFIQKLKEYEGMDFCGMKAKDFENFVSSSLSEFGKIERQVGVLNRGDGRKGRVDLVLISEEKKIGIEIDRKIIRKKSIFKLRELNADRMFCILRSPFSLTEIYR